MARPPNYIFNSFSELAKEYKLKFEVWADSVCLSQKGIKLRVRWQIERNKGIFVTLFDPEKSADEYGLCYLVSFLEGTAEELAALKSHNINLILPLVRKYALQYILGLVDNFSAFASYTTSIVNKNLPDVPVIKANKWIRPEWT